MSKTSSNVSNQYGRALEYAIVAEIIENLPKNQIEITPRTLQDQHRDLSQYESLTVARKGDYKRCAVCVFNWLNKSFSISNKILQVDRLSDPEAKKGDVTDIRIKTNSETINLSIKHNHKALKHQRPAATANHCGFARKSSEDIDFRMKYKEITKYFLSQVSGVSEFSALNPGLVFQNLYIPICNLVSQFINEHCCHPIYASHLFSFLVGKTDYYKIVFKEGSNLLIIEEFSALILPKSVIAQADQNYVHLTFSNHWKISMRLHTASSKIKNSPDLKFDTQPVEIFVSRRTIEI